MADSMHDASGRVRMCAQFWPTLVLLASVAGVLLLPTATAAQCNPSNIPPAISGQLYEGQIEIYGSAPLNNQCSATVEVHDISDNNKVLPVAMGASTEVINGRFRVRLMKPLVVGHNIGVSQINANPQQTKTSDPVTVYRRPVIAGELREGATEITGNISIPSTGCDNPTMEVHALSPGDRLLAQTNGAGSSAAANNAFDVKLQEPLRGNQWIRIDLVCPTFRLSSEVTGVNVPGDWGRIKSYFTSGILLSQDQNSFSQSSLLLAFTLDNGWRLPGWYHQRNPKREKEAAADRASASAKTAKDAADAANATLLQAQQRATQAGPADAATKAVADKAKETATKAAAEYDAALTKAVKADREIAKQPDRDHMGRAPGINTFVEVRLTSIPVNACSTTATTAASSDTSPCAPPAPSPSPTPLETFLSQRKTARFVFGGYLPWTLKAWTYHNTRNGLFAAPLAKVGFDTPTGQLNQIQPAPSGTTTITNTNTVTSVNPASFYNFYGFGGRIGHYELTSPHYHDTAPETLSYLDIIFGPFSNLESLVQPENPAKGTTISRKRIYRLAIEGIYKVPTTPMVIGFSANIGQEAVGVGPFNIVQRAPDDLRFLFGLRFDVGRLVSKLSQASP
jgi:hypothetical protein